MRFSRHMALLLPVCVLFLSTVTACTYSPNPIPAWAADKIDVLAARVFIGRLNATITQTVHPGENIDFAFLSKGEFNSEDWPFAQPTRWKFNLYSRDGTLLCESRQFEDWPDSNVWWRVFSSASKATKSCPYSEEYLKPPLRGTIEWRYKTGDREDQMIPDLTIDTSYYIISDSIPCNDIDPATHKCR